MQLDLRTRALVLRFLQKQPGPVSFDAIRAHFPERVFETYELKAAMWDLLADDFLELTPSRQIIAVSVLHRAYTRPA